MTWNYVEPLHDDMSIREFEADFGVRFPEAYTRLVMQNNNGYPEKDAFCLPDGEMCNMNHLFSFNRDDAETMWGFNSEQTIGEGFVAFAADTFGNPIGFRLEDYAVVFVDYDANEMVEVAADFASFLAGLKASE